MIHCLKTSARWNRCVPVCALSLFLLAVPIPIFASAADAEMESTFRERIEPLIRKYCFDCHNADEMKSGVRVDRLSSSPDDRQIYLWKAIQKQIDEGAMPPKEDAQLSVAERSQILDWIPKAITTAAARNAQYNGSVRRLTVAQYRNTLRDLLGVTENVTKSLPPDGITKDGFTNQSQTLGLSPIQVEAYFEIAEKALSLAIVDESAPPKIQNFKVDLGASINPSPCPDNLILGALSDLLKNWDFVVTELTPTKPFKFPPFRMQTKFDFIEGYAGNDTVRGWRHFDSLYHAVFACMRGSSGYPFGEPYQVVPEGLLLRPAIPSAEIFGQSSTYGPMANFKISLRELPDQGNFRVTVKAARYDDELMLDSAVPMHPVFEGQSIVVSESDMLDDPIVTFAADGLYQVDAYQKKDSATTVLSLEMLGKEIRGKLLRSASVDFSSATGTDEQGSAFALIRIKKGTHLLSVRLSDQTNLKRLVFNRIDDQHSLAKRFAAFQKRSPSVGVHVGLRRDCGSTLSRVGEPIPVTEREPREYLFEGAINDFPSPDVEKDNVNYLAGVREIGIRCEYTDGRDTPRLLIRSVEFEGPYYDSWPPASHRLIFFDSPNRERPAAYARDIIRRFASRAFRRPANDSELVPIFEVWKEAYAKQNDFQQSVKDALLVVLTSPQFLMLIENSHGPEPEDLDSFELASKLSYFLWNTAPDDRLLDLAATNRLYDSMDSELERMVRDDRFGQFVREFASQWLSLDKFDVVSIDSQRFKKLTRSVKAELRQEPIQFVRHLFQQNLSARNLIESDFVMANEVVANYYGLADRLESGFAFKPIQHDNPHLGGLLTQAGILAGLTDGRESNPIKRGAWVARKIVAEPPDDPPPNVPKLPEDDGAGLTLQQKLERHRNQEGCAKCHSGIDPWGFPFEQYDAGGLFKKETTVDSRSKLPDGHEVADVNALRRYLANDRIDQVAFSLLKHIATYASGRGLRYDELELLRRKAVEFRDRDYRLQDMLRYVVRSDLFLKK